MPPKKTSPAWYYFKKKKDNIAECTLCEKDFRYYGSTSNLMDHLKRKHHVYLTMLSAADSLESDVELSAMPCTSTDTVIMTNSSDCVSSFIVCNDTEKSQTETSNLEITTTKANMISTNLQVSPKKRSPAWDFFKKKRKKNVVECTVCKKEIRYHGSTSNLMEHLKRKHHVYLTKIAAADSLESDVNLSAVTCTSSTNVVADNTESVPTNFFSGDIEKSSADTSNLEMNIRTNVIQLVNNSEETPIKTEHRTGTMKYTQLSASKIKQLNNLLVDSIAEEYLPFSIVENNKFIKFVKALEPRYPVPSKRPLENKLIVDRYNEIKETIKKPLNESKSVSISVDIWTLNNTQAYVTVTAHYICTVKIVSAVLSTKELPQHYTVENIVNSIQSIIDEWDITEKTFAMVTENTELMVEVANELGLIQLDCSAHTINSAIAEVYDHPDLVHFTALRQKCRNIVDYFENDSLGISKLTELQMELNKKILKLKKEVSLMWNTTFLMLRRLVEVKEELTMSLSGVDCIDILTTEDWENIEDCLLLLEPLFELTEEMSCEKYLTCSIVIPLARGCQEAIVNINTNTAVGNHLKTYLLEALTKITTLYETDKAGIFAKATILDPRFKKWAFRVEENATNTADEIIKEIIEKAEEEEEVVIEEGVIVEDGVVEGIWENEVQPQKRKRIWNFFMEQKALNEAKTNRTRSSTVSEDMRTYLTMSLMDMHDKHEPILFWQKYKESMKQLAESAFKYLCIPATSVPAKRIFFKLGQIYTERRNGLKRETVDKMLFLNGNNHI